MCSAINYNAGIGRASRDWIAGRNSAFRPVIAVLGTFMALIVWSSVPACDEPHRG
jgi:hypothetical protein